MDLPSEITITMNRNYFMRLLRAVDASNTATATQLIRKALNCGIREAVEFKSDLPRDRYHRIAVEGGETVKVL